MELIEKLPEINERINVKAKDQVYKFAASLELGSKETYDILTKYDVYPILPSHFRAYTVDPRSAQQTLELASKMEFIANIKQNPNLVSCSISEVIKRMGQCDAVGIPYRDEATGLCADYIFSAREFKKQVGPMLENKEALAPVDNTVSFTDYAVTDNDEKKKAIKDYANKLLEIFTLTSTEDKEAIMMAIDKMDVSELSEKEVLMSTFAETFKVGNMELLSSEIDNVLDANTLGRKAA